MTACDLKLISERECAERLGISQRKLWALRKSGEIPHHRFGRAVRYDLRVLEQWLNSREEGGNDS